jgi:hypothetical protein
MYKAGKRLAHPTNNKSKYGSYISRGAAKTAKQCKGRGVPVKEAVDFAFKSFQFNGPEKELIIISTDPPSNTDVIIFKTQGFFITLLQRGEVSLQYVGKKTNSASHAKKRVMNIYGTYVHTNGILPDVDQMHYVGGGGEIPVKEWVLYLEERCTIPKPKVHVADYAAVFDLNEVARTVHDFEEPV